jgi:ABC-type branched-subunit amino acid transport system ATPase component
MTRLVATDEGQFPGDGGAVGGGAGLAVRDVTVKFGGVVALDGVSLSVPRGCTVGLVGPNGSGKTTLINAICGLVPLDRGWIRIGGRDASGRSSHSPIDFGVARTFQSLAVLPDLTVLENVLLGAEHPRSRTIGRTAQERARSALRLLGIDRFEAELGYNLPTGVARRVELARTIVLRPELLLLDEFSSGLDHRETKALVAIVQRLTTSSGVTTVVVEHDLDVVVTLCEWIFVLSAGSLMVEGPPREVLARPEVVASYVGDTFAAELAVRELEDQTASVPTRPSRGFEEQT